MSKEEQAISIIKADGMMERFSGNNPEGLDFNREAGFAVQLLTTSPNAAKLMQCTKESLQDAFYGVAAMGITLNPVMKQIAMVPRAGACVLELQYQGLITLMVKYGIVKRMIPPQVVYQNDKFEYDMSTNKIKAHVSYRQLGKETPGEPIFVYCSAILPDGDMYPAVMTMDRVYQIRDGAQAYKAFKAGKLPEKHCLWVNEHKEEMYKKTAVKQLWKYLPKDMAGAERIATVVDMDNQNEFDVVESTAEVIVDGEPEIIKTKEPSKAAAVIQDVLKQKEQPKVVELVPSNEMVPAEIKETTPVVGDNGEWDAFWKVYTEEELEGATALTVKNTATQRGADIFLPRSEDGKFKKSQYIKAIMDHQKSMGK